MTQYITRFIEPIHHTSWWRGIASLQKTSRVFAVSGPTEQNSVDVFTKKLQEKTERELEELVERREETLDESTSTVQEHKQHEIGGPKGPEPTRFGDWERAGRCSDF